jgi:hypothetical protein
MTQPVDDETEDWDETPGSSRPSLLTALILLFLIIALLATLAWPAIRQVVRDFVPRPTPTSPFLREA